MQIRATSLVTQVPFDITVAAEFKHFASGVHGLAKQITTAPAEVREALSKALIEWASQELDFLEVNS